MNFGDFGPVNICWRIEIGDVGLRCTIACVHACLAFRRPGVVGAIGLCRELWC